MSLAAPLDINMLPEQSQVPDWLGPTSTFLENIDAVYDSQAKVNSQFGLTEMWTDELQARDDEVFKLTGKRPGVYATYPEFSEEFRKGLSGWDVQKGSDPLSPATRAMAEAYEKARIAENQIAEFRKQFPQIKTRDDIFKSVSEKRAEIEGRAGEVSTRAGVTGVIGGLLGGMAGSMTTNSPVNVATLPVGGFGKTIVTRVGTEAMTQMAIAGVDQAFVAKEYSRMGETLSARQAAGNIAFAGLGGAAVRGVAEGGGVILKNLRDRAEIKDSTGKLADSLLSAETPEQRAAIMTGADPEDVAAINEIVNPVQSTAQRGAVQAAEVETFTEKANPFEQADPINGDKMHQDMLTGVTAALEAEQPLPRTPAAMPRLVSDIYKRVDVETFPVENLTVDASAMQFKSGGDEAGVTDRLKGTKAWSDYLAGVITVWKKEDGTIVVADGHQRVGFAKRLMAADPEQKISIPAFVFKESDGDTQAFVRAAAALRNISEGSGSALDAAKVFKDMPSKAKAVFDSLPPNSAIVKQGLNLASLDNEAYMMVLNGVVDERIGAVVGRLEENTDKQRALMALLAKEEPDTVFQAEEIIRQAQQAGFDTTTQATLFGAESVTESLFKDKAKVLERGLNLIKSDIKTFRSLLNNSERIAEAGNALNNSANAAILGDSNTILQTVQALAYRKGPIADLLTEAAKEAKRNGRYKQGAERFVSALRGRLDEGGISGLFDGAAGDVSDALAEVTRRIESENVAANIVDTGDLFNAQPETIERGYSDLVAARDAQAAAPAAKMSAREAGSEPSSKPILASGAGTQAAAGLSQRTARKPSDVFSTANIAPETLTGGKAKLGIRDSSNQAVVYHVANDKATLVKKAEGYVGPVADFIGDAIRDVRGAEFSGARVKALKDIDNKIEMLGRRPDQVSDYLGARITVDSIAAAREVQAKLGESARVVEVDDFLEAARPGGSYHAVHMQLMTKDGFSYEVQIIPRDLMDVYDKARPSYAEWKDYRGNIPKDKEKAYIKAKTQGDKVFAKAWKKFQERDLMEQRIKAFDVNDEVPVSIEFDTMGNEVVRTAKLGDLMADIESHESLLKNMTECLI